MGPDSGGSGGVPADVAARLMRAFDMSPSTVVALISEDLRNVWVSRSVAWVVGEDPDTAMQEQALTRVHPDDVGRLLHGLAQARSAAPANAPSLRAVEPLRFRVERSGGGWTALEALVINLLDDPAVSGLVAIVRPVGGEVEGVGRVVDLLVADAPLRDVLAACAGLVPDYVGSAAVVAMRKGRPVIAAPAGSPAERLGVDERWWRDTLADGRARTATDHEGFPDDLATQARDAGFRSTWVLPLCDVATGEVIGCLVVWVRIAVEPNVANEAGVRQAERLGLDERWWRDTLADGRARTATDHEGFPDDLATQARDAGFRSTWVLPLCDVATGEVIGCLVVWVRIAVEPNVANEAGVRQAERLARLVIGEQRRHDALRHEALTDPLTRVANRSALRARFDTATDPLTVVIVDLDGFKLVNDTHGHEAGDAVLRVVAQRIVRAVRQDDLVVRLGGDEFAIVFAAGTEPEGMVRSMRRVVDSIGQPIKLGDLTVTVGASAGLATGRPPEVLREADRALYEAKGVTTVGMHGSRHDVPR